MVKRECLVYLCYMSEGAPRGFKEKGEQIPILGRCPYVLFRGKLEGAGRYGITDYTLDRTGRCQGNWEGWHKPGFVNTSYIPHRNNFLPTNVDTLLRSHYGTGVKYEHLLMGEYGPIVMVAEQLISGEDFAANKNRPYTMVQLAYMTEAPGEGRGYAPVNMKLLFPRGDLGQVADFIGGTGKAKIERERGKKFTTFMGLGDTSVLVEQLFSPVYWELFGKWESK